MTFSAALPSTTTPQSKPKRSLLPTLGLANFGIHLALMTPMVFTLALRVRHVVIAQLPPGSTENHIGTQAAETLGLVAGVGAVFALIANPLFGRLSDRTSSRFGMRRPWIIGGSMGLLLSLAVLATATSTAGLLIAWCLAQTFGNATLAAINAAVPDQVPTTARGRASGVIGIASPIAMLCGAGFSRALPADADFARFTIPGAIGLLCSLVFVMFLADRRLEGEPPPFRMKEFFGSFIFNPKKHPDFGWVWISKFCVTYGFVGVQAYLTFFLISALGLSEDDAKKLVFQATLVMVITTVTSAIVGGSLSDRFSRRPFVAVAGLIAVVGVLLLVIAPSAAMVPIAFAVIGIGQGTFNAADLALATLVLPSTNDTAKDLGVLTMASSLPQSIAPAVAPALIALGGGVGGAGYQVFFLVGAAISALGALLVFRVRTVS